MRFTRLTFKGQETLREGLDMSKYEMFVSYDRTPEVVTEKKSVVVLKKYDDEFQVHLAEDESFVLCDCAYPYFATPEKALAKAKENWGSAFSPEKMTLTHKVYSGDEKIDGTGHGYLRPKRKLSTGTKTSWAEITGYRWGT